MPSNAAGRDTVYHLTSHNNWESIQRNGLRSAPPEEQHISRRVINEAVDAVRPGNIVALGLARHSAVYAHPLLERVSKYSTGSMVANADRTDNIIVERPIAIGIAVDPEKTLVLDKQRLQAVARSLTKAELGGDPEENQQRIDAAARAYWGNAITLEQYKTQYDPEHRTHFDMSRDSQMPYYIDTPEVLVPGPVNPTEVSWAASILVARAAVS